VIAPAAAKGLKWNIPQGIVKATARAVFYTFDTCADVF
jgi:hypothetical protein